VPRIVFDAVAVTDLGQHFQVVAGALLQPLRFNQLVLRVQLLEALAQLDLDGFHRLQHGAGG
jgi:hypothetical protein